MSASKEGFAPAQSGGGRGWADVSPMRRCPICGKGSWCQLARDGATVLCKRVGNGSRPRTNREGAEFYTHHLGARPWHPPAEAPAPATSRAAVDDCDRAYRLVLASLRLDDCDRDNLRARGLDDETIAANGYRTLPVTGRARIARAIVGAVGEHVARAVPGVAWKTDDGRGWWTLTGAPGLLVPERDLGGRVVALKVRRRDVEPGQQRYLYLSSASRGGASAASVLHVPVAAQAMRGVAPVVTEGPLKADVATHLLGSRPVVSLPGVGSWALALDFVEAWGSRDVAVAFDSDARTNRHVMRALVNLVDGLRAAGCRVETWQWDGPAKGLDDFLCAMRRDEEANP